ncbi:MAG: ribonuclease E/G, partial [Rhodobacteraceae bacterium]|nr:ribonuclease E/G [Paracoccaceae bacterium]
MGKKLLIDATHAEETRVVVVDGNKVEEFDFETIHKRQLAGNIYLAKVTRVEPSLQAAFVDYGGNRHGFLAFAEIHPDYYQIPVADREALLAEERALARDSEDESNGSNSRRSRRRRSGKGNGDEAARPDGAEAEQVEAGEDAAVTPVEEIVAEEAIAAETVADAPQETPLETPAEVPAEAPVEAPVEPLVEAGEAAPVEVPAETPAEEPAETPVEIPVEALIETAVDGGDDEGGDDAPRSGSIAANAEGMETRTYGAMDVVDLEDEDEGEKPAAEEPFRAADHASELDDQIESVADEDVTDEVRPQRRPRSRRYKIQEVIKVRQIMLVQVV